jgi:hypothetical protein
MGRNQQEIETVHLKATRNQADYCNMGGRDDDPHIFGGCGLIGVDQISTHWLDPRDPLLSVDFPPCNNL